VRRIEEDTDGNGKPDLWEEYDQAEALVKRSKDLNDDGQPDMEETINEAAGEPVSNGESEQVGR
jgi:hypothetical protein